MSLSLKDFEHLNTRLPYPSYFGKSAAFNEDV
jgi:hypothetical protein